MSIRVVVWKRFVGEDSRVAVFNEEISVVGVEIGEMDQSENKCLEKKEERESEISILASCSAASWSAASSPSTESDCGCDCDCG